MVLPEEKDVDHLADAFDQRRADHLADPGKSPPMCCRKCLYDLRGTPDHYCPECGRFFDPRLPHSYTKLGRKERVDRRRQTLKRITVLCGGYLFLLIMWHLLVPDSVHEWTRENQWLGNLLLGVLIAACLLFSGYRWVRSRRKKYLN